MALDQSFEFEVDGQYENEKGVFTVLSIKNGIMEIQWADGEKIHTEVDLQRGIQIRRQMEEYYAEAAAALKARKAARAAGGRNARFDGLQPGDFKETAARTRWRGREQLGGAVSQHLPRDIHAFQSWALAQRPEIHWQDTAHRKRSGDGFDAAFFVRLDQQTLTYGFRVARPAPEEAGPKDWQSVTAWLKDEKNQQILLTIASENDLALTLRSPADVQLLKAKESNWHEAGKSAKISAGRPAKLMAAAATSAPITVEVFGSMSKEDALNRKTDVAKDIAALFERLMPLYRGALVYRAI